MCVRVFECALVHVCDTHFFSLAPQDETLKSPSPPTQGQVHSLKEY